MTRGIELNKSSAKLLIVDDIIANLHALRRLLEVLDIEILEAESGQDALSLAIEHDFFAILMDVQMPEMNGFETASILHENPRTRQLPIIFLTAINKNEDFIIKGYKSGAIDYLTKPINEDILINKIKVFLELYHQRIKIEDQNQKLISAIKKIGHAQFSLLETESHHKKGIAKLRFYPKEAAGGDFLARYELPNDRYFLLMTDVSGHDLEAAFVSAYFQGYVNGSMNDDDLEIEDMLQGFNTYLLNEWGNSDRGHDITQSIVVCGLLLDYNNMQVTTYTCGSSLPVIIDHTKTSKLLSQKPGFPLGWFESITITPSICNFTSSSKFYFWSDGLDALAEMLKVNIFSLIYRLYSLGSSHLKPGWMAGADDDVLLIEVSTAQENDIESLFRTCYFSQYQGGADEQIEALQDDWIKSLGFSISKRPGEILMDIIQVIRDTMLTAFNEGSCEDNNRATSLTMQYNLEEKRLRVIIESIEITEGTSLKAPAQKILLKEFTL